jgi:hypothetical protein
MMQKEFVSSLQLSLISTTYQSKYTEKTLFVEQGFQETTRWSSRPGALLRLLEDLVYKSNVILISGVVFGVL